MIRTAKRWLLEELDIELPDGEINGTWFAEHNLPMIVACHYCKTTLALPSAMIDDEGTIYCCSCIV